MHKTDADDVIRIFKEIVPRGDFSKLANQSLRELLGDAAALAIIHHMGGSQALHDPKVFAERLVTTLGKEGAAVILRYIRVKV
jgi:hypothetical protein